MRAWIGRVVRKNLELVSVVPVQSLLRAEPHETVVVLKDGIDDRLRQTILGRDVVEMDVFLVSGSRMSREAHENQGQGE